MLEEKQVSIEEYFIGEEKKPSKLSKIIWTIFLFSSISSIVLFSGSLLAYFLIRTGMVK